MSDPIQRKLAANLSRWQASGEPEHWCAARAGHWTEDDWQKLLTSLWWTNFWPMDTAAVRALLEELSKPLNLRRWRESGQPLEWIKRQDGVWHHGDWLALLESLARSAYWPVDASAVGGLLEHQRVCWRNLERWLASGLPQRWAQALQGRWNHADWLTLVESLEQSAYWPLDLDAVSRTLVELKQAQVNLLRWQQSGHPERWVELRQGSWNPDQWLALLDALADSEYWPLEPAAVGRVVEGVRREWWNLKRWRDSGLARRWVETHHGTWNHDDWQELLATLHSTGYWPIAPAALARALEEVRDEWRNLQRLRASSQAREWVNDRDSAWTAVEFEELLEALWQTEYWPLDNRAVSAALHELAGELEPSRAANVFRFPERPAARAPTRRAA